MHMTHPKIWIASLAVVVVALNAQPARADGKNEIRAVTFEEEGGMTRVHVRGAQTPTFTVYKLERPSRVVIDVPQARLAEALRGHEGASVYTPSTWAVSTIAAQQIDDGGQVVRVIVTLARPGRYDVKTDGNEVVVMVTARDAAPRNASPEALAKAQSESEQARRAAATAEQARAQAEKVSAAAQAEAERLRKAAADQMARADAAQRAAEDAKRAGQQASSADIERAKTLAAAARDEAAKAKLQATRAQDEAAKAKLQVARAETDAQRMRMAAEQAKRDALAETDRARKEAAVAKQDVLAAQQDAARTKAEADAAMAKTRAGAMKDLDAANRAKAEAEAARKDAEVARREAATTKDAATRARAEADAARADAARTKAEAESARIEAEQARRDVAQKRMEAETARVEAAKAKDDIAKSTAMAARAQSEADAAKADAARARTEAKAARAEAEAAKMAAAADKRQAEADKQRAEASRTEASKMLKDAKTQLATLDKKTLQVQSLEDKARAAHAAAQAREEAARETVARATREREAAEAAAKQAALARDRSSSQVATDREKLIAEAKVAEDRLARAKHAADEAEMRRVAAETAASGAKKDLEQTRFALLTVEQQRASAEKAAGEAARKRGEAEAAASDAARRRTEAETAASFAARQRSEAEQAAQAASKQRTEAEHQRIAAEMQRKAAESAAREAQAAKIAADKQRAIAEKAAGMAVAAKHDAEASLETLMERRQAAEKAAADLEARSKAEAHAQAQVAAAKARKANEDELAKARAEATRLADQRKRAESELADRRKAVAAQQAESDRLKVAAAQARDAAEREESRRSTLAQQRAVEEQELARIKAQKADAVKVAAVPMTPAAPVVTVAAKPAIKAAFVKDITFKSDDSMTRVDIAMTGEGAITIGDVTATHVELIIDGAELGAKLERKLDVSKFGSPIRAVSSFRDRRTPNRVRLIAELDAPMTSTFDRTSTGVKWSFVGNQVAKRPTRTQNVPSPVVGGFGAASTPIAPQSVSQVPAGTQGARNRKVYRGATVDFDFKDAPIHDLLRTIADTGKVNIVVPDGINARVTVRLKRVPWDQALEVILASHGLWYRRDGNLFRIAPRKELDAEDEAEAARREAMIKSEVPRPEIVPLNYASSADLRGKLEAMLSPKGRIEVDERTNALIINDVAGNREQIARLALQLDRQTPQISIEARIVEARSTFLRQFGIQWGGRALASSAGGNATGLIFPSSIGIAGGNDSAATPSGGVTATPSDFAINLPAATGGGEGGAIGMSLGSLGGNFNLNLRLSALEDTGTVRIISAPKITVLNNREAKISQGVSIPISVVSAAGTQTQFVQADLALTVIPKVSQRDCAIEMNLTVTKNEPDFVNVGARGDPSILRKEAKTSMLVNDGETSVLGGIYTRNTGLAYKKVPFFADLPVIGWFFKNRRENDDRTEILVFITPKITNRGLLGCQ
ncbi:MAG: type pilus secretin PilQ [Myxococcales bacterium]|nr:type pilus secretin PilQ [Myxococcales bacterium]